MLLPLQDCTVVVIGGTSGLGLSASHAILKAGGRVVAVGRDDEHLIDARDQLGDRAHVIAGEASDPGTAEIAIGDGVRRFGGFDALYHVAGGSGRSQGDGPLHELTDAGIGHTLQANLASVLYSNRGATRYWVEREQPGVILNMASVLAFAPSAGHFSTHVYAAAKAGIIGLTKSAAAYYAKHHIRVNAIAPGLVETPMAQRAASDPEIMRFIRRKQPLDGGRLAQPHDLDAAAVLLLSRQSTFITGQVLGVDGGWSVSEGGET